MEIQRPRQQHVPGLKTKESICGKSLSIFLQRFSISSLFKCLILFHFTDEDLCNTMTCGAGEAYLNGECRCGDIPSCVGEISGSYCDFESSQCKCSRNQETCANGLICTHGVCEGSQNVLSMNIE